ncbi:MAG: wax ester/triacylglycerol synthase family O-acyltransferase [Halioglobus sp.]
MQKLSPQDAGFLKLESERCPFHVGGLMLFKLPERASPTYLRQFANRMGRMNRLWPLFNQQLSNPDDLANAAWVEATDYRSERHVLHYALPAPGRMADLLALVTRAHERPLDKWRPLWELHLIEGLQGERFAVYMKVHHALLDGVGAMKLLRSMLATSPDARINFRKPLESGQREHSGHSLYQQLASLSHGLLEQYRALPDLARMLSHMGADVILNKKNKLPLPFTSPHSILNLELDSSRRVITCELPLSSVKRIGRQTGGTVNDVLVAICGGALRRYLLQQGELPAESLVAGMPVSLKASENEGVGNKLSYLMCPFFTEEVSDLQRLERVIAVTRHGKDELERVSAAAAMDYYAMIMVPTILLTVTGNATKVRPACNTILSNVPGSQDTLYLDGAELEALYPLSIVTDGMGLNITSVSYAGRLCIAAVSCPARQPGIEALGKLIRESYRALRMAVDA